MLLLHPRCCPKARLESQGKAGAEGRAGEGLPLGCSPPAALLLAWHSLIGFDRITGKQQRSKQGQEATMGWEKSQLDSRLKPPELKG